MSPRFSPDNSPEARERRKQAYMDRPSLSEIEQRIINHRFGDPVVRECRLVLIDGGKVDLPPPEQPNTDALAA